MDAKTLTESKVTWIDAEHQLPDSDNTVLIHCPQSDDPIWLGYHDGQRWRDVSGYKLHGKAVAHWADLPDFIKPTEAP